MSTIAATIPSASDSVPAASRSVTAPQHTPGWVTTAATCAGRTLPHFARTPQLIVVGALTSTIFLLIFRYVFGGAIRIGGSRYVDLLIPGLAAAGGLFAGVAVGVADDIDGGKFDRLLSLPIPRSAVLLGRSLADTVLVAWATLITVSIGFATGFRLHGGVPSGLAALALCVVFGAAFTWPLIYIGLTAGNAQAAQGMSFMAFPLVFVSSAYVPISSMPGWLQPVAEHQPVT
jgi:ABC-2 type transport system permease protein